MRVAIPVCRGRVSPLFDEARELLIANVPDDGHGRVQHTPLGADRAAGLVENAVDVLICGAVSTPLRQRLLAAGTTVHDWVRGDALEVLTAFAAGRLQDARYRLPGARPAPVGEAGASCS